MKICVNIKIISDFRKKDGVECATMNNNIFILYNFVSLLVAKHYYNTG